MPYLRVLEIAYQLLGITGNEEAAKVKGTYASVVLSPASEKRLETYYKDHVPNLVDDFHITTTHSRRHLPKLEGGAVSFALDPQHFEHDIFGDDENVLVLRVNHPKLHDLWRQAMQMGASYDHDKFRPHITLCSNFKGKLEKLPPTPKFKLYAEKHIVDELKE